MWWTALSISPRSLEAAHLMPRSFQCTLLLLLSSGAVAAATGNLMPSHRHDLWGAPTGFPGGYISSIVQTSDGYIWIGTSKGLVRYDGLAFVHIHRKESSAEARLPVLRLLVDSDGQLWATDEFTRLFKYASGQLLGPALDNNGDQYPTGLLAITREGWLLVASESHGMVAYEHGAAHVLLASSLMPRAPTAVAQTPDGTFWIGTREAGVFRVSLARGVPEIQHLAAPANLTVNCLLPIGDSNLLIGTDRGLLRLHNGALTDAQSQLRNLDILSLASGRNGNVWIGTDGHVFEAHGRDIDGEGTIRALNELKINASATALFVDRDGDLWIGEPEFIERYRNSGFTTYLNSEGLPCNNCGAIYVDHQDRLWFAPWDGGLFLLSQGSLRRIDTAGLQDDTVYSIAGGADDEVWIARKAHGLTRLQLQGDSLQSVNYTRENGLADDSVYSIYRAADGAVWAGTLAGGVSRFRDGAWQTFATRDGLPSNTISAITGNSAGDVFVGTPNGLAVFTHNHWAAYTAQHGLPPGTIESLFVDSAGILWIGTSKGISFFQAGALHVPLGAPDALYGEILGIAESKDWLWITTPYYVLRVRTSALLNQSFREGDYREFGLAEGLPSTEGVKRSRSVVSDIRGRIWLSLNKGISVLEPSAFAAPDFPVTIRLDDMLVDGRAVPSDSLIRIPSGRHRLTFRYDGVNVANPDGVRYRYHLDNVDPAWSEPTAAREIDYTNTPPGRFQFHVMARNPDGLWSGQETTLAFEIEPAYWQTRWFRIGSVVALLLLVFGFYRLRVGELHREFHAALDARVNERTRIARELHDTLLQSFQGLLLRFQTVSNLLPGGPQAAKEKLDHAIDLAAQAITEGRSAVQGLRSSTVVQNDLAVAVSTLGKELATNETSPTNATGPANATNPTNATNQGCPDFRVHVEGEPRDLHPILRDEVYRIAGEALRNAFRHAQAQRIEVEIHYDVHRMRVRVRDDGKGIDPQVLAKEGRAGHWGLNGMRERAKLIGGNLEVWSSAQSGTEVELTIPASAAYAKAKMSRGA